MKRTLHGKKKIFFVIPNLISGGAQRTILNILNAINSKKFNITLIVYKKEGDLFFELDKKVKIISLNANNSFQFFYKLIFLIRKNKPDILFSTIRLINFLCILAVKLSFQKTKIIIRETNNHSEAKIDKTPLQMIIDKSYSYANLVIALSKGVASDINYRSNIDTDKLKVIYNPVNIDFINKQKTKPLPNNYSKLFKNKNDFKIINVGHLEYQKGQDLLIDAVSQIKDKVKFKLFIIGEGSMRVELERKIEKLKLNKHVFLLGKQKNPYNFMAKSDLFILSSRWEGFGHVLVEAMATNTPVVSSNCNSGPNEIISHNLDGLLIKVNSKRSIVKSINLMYSDKNKRELFKKNGNKKKKVFMHKLITNTYEKEFEKL